MNLCEDVRGESHVADALEPFLGLLLVVVLSSLLRPLQIDFLACLLDAAFEITAVLIVSNVTLYVKQQDSRLTCRRHRLCCRYPTAPKPPCGAPRAHPGHTSHHHWPQASCCTHAKS